MEEFLKIDWYPSLDDVIDNVFIDEKRLKDESAMYRIMRGVFKDPFTELESDDGDEHVEPEEEKEEEDEELENNKSIHNDNNDNVKSDNKRSETGEDVTHAQREKRWIPGLGQPPSFRFPRSSNLSKSQHATCLRVLLRFSGSEKPEMNQTNRNELELYMKLLPTIKKEQDEFLNLAKTNWKCVNMKLVGKEYINARWKYKIQNVLKLPRYYVAGINVPFNGEMKIGIEFETTLLETGRIPGAVLPLDNKRNMLRCNINKLYRLYPVHNNILNDSNGKLIPRTVPVSQDQNCEQLAESNEVDLVISSAGLNCLATNLALSYNSSWTLPIVVKGNEKRNIVYVDKPLPPIGMTMMQKNAWIYKYILKSELLDPKHPFSMGLSEEEETDDDIFENSYADELLRLEEESDKCPSYAAGKKSNHYQPYKNVSTGIEEEVMVNNIENKDDFTAPERKEESDLSVAEKLSEPLVTDNFNTMHENNVVDKEIFTGFDSLESAALNSNVKVNISNEKVDDSSEFDSLENEALCSTLEVNTNNEKNEVSITLNFDSLENTVLSSKKLDTTDEKYNSKDEKTEEDIEKAETSHSQFSTKVKIPFTCPPAENNFTYRIFSLGPSEDTTNDVAKSKVDRYRILVRNRIDGIEKIGEQATHPVMLLPKLEHQVQLGAEAVTAEEALKQWMALTFRPETSLVRVRISAETSEIIQVERRTTTSINNEIKRLYKMNAEDSLITLHNVVRGLKTLKPGKYLLRHTPSNGAFATIYDVADSTGKNVFDLHATYSLNYFQTISKSQWPTIDTVVVTPALAFYERMPAMYYPARTDSTSTFKNARGRGRGRGAGGRGRGVFHRDGEGERSKDGTTVLRGGKRVRTKPAQKKKNKKSKTEEIQQP